MAETVVLKVGMSCEGCVGAVKRVLGKMQGQYLQAPVMIKYPEPISLVLLFPVQFSSDLISHVSLMTALCEETKAMLPFSSDLISHVSFMTPLCEETKAMLQFYYDFAIMEA